MSECVGEPLVAGKIPGENQGSTLDTYEPRDSQQAEALRLACMFVEADDQAAGLMLVGEPGNGKTHLAVGIARAVEQRGGRVAFINFHRGMPDLEHIPGAPQPLGWWPNVELLVDTFDVIVVDDIPGDMLVGPRGLLQAMILTSYAKGKRMVVTSNQPYDNIVELIAAGTGRQADLYIAVKERIKQAWLPVEFTGESYRSQQRKWWETDPAQDLLDLARGMGREEQLRLLTKAVLELAQASRVTGEAIRKLQQSFGEQDSESS